MREYLEKSVGKLTLGKAICSIRHSLGTSQIDYAKQLGVSKQFLCGLEYDRKIVSAKKAKQFAENLGYSAEQFIAFAIQDSLEHDGLHMIVDVKAA